MKKVFAVFAMISMTALAFGQQSEITKYITRNGHIRFFSTTPVEDIQADNHEVSSILDRNSARFVFQAPIKGFQFEKALMQEHFNENYMESNKFPQATFDGTVVNIKDVDFKKQGTYNVTVKGKMTIHGVTKEIEEKGTITVQGDMVLAKAKFIIVVADYNIEIPGMMKDKIAKQVEVTVDLKMDGSY